jgi:predicted nucleic acid-binding protein
MIMSKNTSYFWDSCIFLAWLHNEARDNGNLESIGQFLEEAKSGLITIYSSTLIYAEVAGNIEKKGERKNISQVFAAIEGSVVCVSPNDIIMRIAALLRSVKYVKNGSERKPGERPLGTVDAIMLATAIYVEGTGEKLTEFHTYDKGKSRSEGRRTVPLLGYEEWCGSLGRVTNEQKELVGKAIGLKRVTPAHPNPLLFL